MKNTFITSWKRLLSLLKMEKEDLLQVLYYAIFAGILSLSLPLGIQAIVNLIQGAQISTSWVVLVILVSLAVVFVGILELLQFRIIENIQQKLFVRASFEFSNRFPKIKMSEFHNAYPPELANRFFDILNVQKGVSKLLIDFPAALLQILLGLILLSLYHPFFIIYGLLLLGLIYVLFKYSAQKGLQTSLEESKHKYKVAHWIQEIARSVVSFKLSGKTQLALDKNDKLVMNYVLAREKHFKILAFQFSKMIVFKLLVTAGLLVVGGLLVLNQQMNIGQFVAAEIIILLIIGSVEKLILGLESFYDVLTSLEKLGQVLDKDLENQKGYVDLDLNTEMDIELKNISYQDGEDLILNSISLHIPAKQKILLQGDSGSGKSTFLRLLAGIIEPTQGDFYINNFHQNTVKLNNYRTLLGISLAEETPFEGTILENLTFGDTSIDAKFIHEIIDLVGLTDFVKSQEKGLQTILYPEGKKISYTLSKKIILARAILKRPKFFILKEPLDQFDVKEAQAIVAYLTKPNRDWGLIVVSREPYWETKVDKKIELRNGTLIS
ncbi:MAG: ATP-binding cassette domain-containing protein [Flavobacteriaceae bacterium]